MKLAIVIFQIILSVTLTALIFLQPNDSQAGRTNILSTVKYEKRGWEKVMFTFTIVILTLFILSSVILTII